MARPEAEIDGSTPEGQFALGLRALREEARLDYRAMEKLVHFASSTLSKAASGNGLPTLDVTLAYVRACDGDVQEWEARWREVRGTVRSAPRIGTAAVPSQRGSEVREESDVDELPDLAGDVPDVLDEQELPQIPEQPDPEATDRIPRLALAGEAAAPDGRQMLMPRRHGAHRAVRSSARRASTLAVAALILLNISLLAALAWSTRDREAASQSASVTTTAASIQSFEIAEIEEPPLVLKAGAVEVRWVDLRNPNAADLVVTELMAQVKIPEDDSRATSRRCSADVLKISNLQGFPYRIDGGGKTRVGFRFEVDPGMSTACEGRVVPVSYTGKAIQGTIIEGRVQAG